MKIKPSKTRINTKFILKLIASSVMLLVIPHPKNDYRPHLIRRYGLVIIIFIIAGLQLGYNGSIAGKVLGSESGVTISSLLEQTNLARSQTGIAKLKLNNKLNQAAYLKAQNMFAKQYWAHNAPDGTQPWKWLGDVGYNYDTAGENLAKNFASANTAITAWMNSPEHRDNILNSNYQDVGFAVVNGKLLGQPTMLIVAFYGLSAADMTTAGVYADTNPAVVGQTGILGKFVTIFQSATPVIVAALALVNLALVVAILAHIYRQKLPKRLRQSWYLHHGLYKAVGLMSLSLVILLLFDNGQI